MFFQFFIKDPTQISFFSLIFILLCLFLHKEGLTSTMDVGANVESEIQISFEGGKNQHAKQTTLVGTAINFGSVSFVNPSLIGTGDAYLEKNYLILEGVIDVGIAFNVVSRASLYAKKLNVSDNPFDNVYYSLSLSRSDPGTEIQTDPRRNTLTSITESSTVPVRFLFKISPKQEGRIYDRIKMEVEAQ